MILGIWPFIYIGKIVGNYGRVLADKYDDPVGKIYTGFEGNEAFCALPFWSKP